jgi:hypothetical protein
MENKRKKITLGFTNQKFEQGAHICQIFSEDLERHEILTNFIISGLNDGENTACFSENETENTLADFFLEKGYTYKEVQNAGNFSLSKTGEVYFENDEFEPGKMLSLLKEFYLTANKQNRSGARVIGEMTSQIQDVKGGSLLLEYECKVSMLLKEFPVTAVCQYDARKFDGSTIMDVLKVHPYMIVKGSIVSNPFYITPEDYLSGQSTI